MSAGLVCLDEPCIRHDRLKQQMVRKIKFIICLLCAVSILAACQPVPTVEPTAVLTLLPPTTEPATPTAAIKATRVNTATARPVTASATPLPATAEPVATSSALWQDAKVLSGGFLPNWEYLVIFETSSKLQGTYSAVADQNKPYQCELRPAYPDRLYCWGRQVRYADDAPIVVYNDRQQIVFEGQFYTPDR